jgi:hypothetical protein
VTILPQCVNVFQTSKLPLHGIHWNVPRFDLPSQGWGAFCLDESKRQLLSIWCMTVSYDIPAFALRTMKNLEHHVFLQDCSTPALSGVYSSHRGEPPP